MKENKYDAIVIGAGLTGLTTAFYLNKAGKKVAVVEKENRIGGQIGSFKQEGFVFEQGPNTGVVSHPEVAELFQDLSPLCTLETAKEESKYRLIWKGKKFHAIPSSLLGGLFTPLFTLPDKFRLLGEPFRKKGTNPDETVAQLAARRLGKSFVDYAVDPFLSGVYAGDPNTLITRYALPRLYNLEQNYNSFIRGTIAKMREPKTERDKLASKKVFSAKDGLSQLTDAMGKRIGEDQLFTSANNTVVSQLENKEWKVSFTQNEKSVELIADHVITTSGAYTLPEILPFVEKEWMDAISNLTYAPVVQISVGVKDTGDLDFNAFGGLVPSREKRDVLGILFPSGCFDGRAPEKGAIFAFFIGGVKRAELTRLSDKELEELVIRNFHEMLHFPKTKKPDLIHIFRHKKAIPQYELNSGERFAAVDAIQKKYPGLIIAGNLKGGIGMADRIKQGVTIANELSK